jgi:hypothetical protein
VKIHFANFILWRRNTKEGARLGGGIEGTNCFFMMEVVGLHRVFKIFDFFYLKLKKIYVFRLF